jgi:hypothetical protein
MICFDYYRFDFQILETEKTMSNENENLIQTVAIIGLFLPIVIIPSQ